MKLLILSAQGGVFRSQRLDDVEQLLNNLTCCEVRDGIEVDIGELHTEESTQPSPACHPVLQRLWRGYVFTKQVTKRGRIGDILMSVRAPVGEVSRATFDVCLGRGVCAIRYPNDFLYHYLIFLEPTWAKHSKGSTFDSVNSTDVKEVEIKLPASLPEQTAIAAVLSDMDAELAALEARRAKTRDLKQAMMQELLTGRTRLV